MQKRHTDRERYFRESALTASHYYIPYIKQFHNLADGCRVLEIGCGEGGNLKPFAEIGCEVTGIDLAHSRTEQARQYFEKTGLKGNFVCCDFSTYPPPPHEENKFDIIILHDVIEHIPDKYTFLSHIGKFMQTNGILFVAFPAWQMPFGGHQQICHHKLWSRCPFLHLLPTTLYKFVLERIADEEEAIVKELLYIKSCKCPIELFEKIIGKINFRVVNRQLWFINPHYLQKFGLKPRRLYPLISKLPHIRNYFSTSCFYILAKPS